VKSYVRNTINLSCAKILLTSVIKGNIPVLFWKGTVTWLISVMRVQGITSLDHLTYSLFLLKFIVSWLREGGCWMRMASSMLWHVTHRRLTVPIQGVGQRANCNKPTSPPNQKCRCLSKVTRFHVRCTTGMWKTMQHWHLGNDCGLNWTSLRSPGASTGAHFRLSQTLLPSLYEVSDWLTDRTGSHYKELRYITKTCWLL